MLLQCISQIRRCQRELCFLSRYRYNCGLNKTPNHPHSSSNAGRGLVMLLKRASFLLRRSSGGGGGDGGCADTVRNGAGRSGSGRNGSGPEIAMLSFLLTFGLRRIESEAESAILPFLLTRWPCRIRSEAARAMLSLRFGSWPCRKDSETEVANLPFLPISRTAATAAPKTSALLTSSQAGSDCARSLPISGVHEKARSQSSTWNVNGWCVVSNGEVHTRELRSCVFSWIWRQRERRLRPWSSCKGRA